MKNDPRNRKQYEEALIQMKPHQFAYLLTKFAPQLSKSEIDTIILEASDSEALMNQNLNPADYISRQADYGIWKYNQEADTPHKYNRF